MLRAQFFFPALDRLRENFGCLDCADAEINVMIDLRHQPIFIVGDEIVEGPQLFHELLIIIRDDPVAD